MTAFKTTPRRERRTARLDLRLTPTELAEARRRACGRPLSGILRAALLGQAEPKVRPGPRPRIPMTEYEATKAAQLAWFGNNLNQLAKAVNAGLIRDGVAVSEALLRLEATMKEVVGDP